MQLLQFCVLNETVDASMASSLPPSPVLSGISAKSPSPVPSSSVAGRPKQSGTTSAMKALKTRVTVRLLLKEVVRI